MCFAPQRRALFRHFFDIWTSKSGPRPSVFNTFDLEMCFAPQRRALFRHLNFQKRSDAEVFCTFWLGNVLRATTACTFSTSQLPKVVRTWCVLYILTWKCASRHNGVQFFIVPVASWVRTRRFSEPTFRPSGATNHWKNTVFRDFPTFSRICIFCPLTLSLLIFSLLIFLFSLPLPCSAFHLSILSEVWLLNFLRLSKTLPKRSRPTRCFSATNPSDKQGWRGYVCMFHIIRLRFNPEPLWRKLPRNIRKPTCDKIRNLQKHDLHLPAISFGTCIKMPSPAKLQLSDCPECRWQCTLRDGRNCRLGIVIPETLWKDVDAWWISKCTCCSWCPPWKWWKCFLCCRSRCERFMCSALNTHRHHNNATCKKNALSTTEPSWNWHIPAPLSPMNLTGNISCNCS